MSFDEARKRVFYATSLGVGAETLLYRPADGGAAREITAKFHRSQQTLEREAVVSDAEEATVVVGRDEAHAKGGVAWPAPDDLFQRIEAPDQPVYKFTGRITYETPHSLHLVCQRSARRRLGAEARAR